RDAVTGGEITDARADLDDGAGTFVAEDHRGLDDERADPPVGDVVHVGCTDPDGVHGDADVARAGRGDRSHLLDRHPSLLLQNECAHVSSTVGSPGSGSILCGTAPVSRCGSWVRTGRGPSGAGQIISSPSVVAFFLQSPGSPFRNTPLLPND